ncbi:DNA-binding protein [Herbaspirillum sp. NPDC087042]|uniref:DNA-binding protein n=1 Tax=Herbaspirillum sp. NPDC087042 TaxID=3364004 RepID=UPI00381A9B8C
MARTGLYKSEIKIARDALLAQGKHPSVDAVRIALGNTGSKSTIHKYLKELEQEDGGIDASKPSISDALQDLVARLAAGLQQEADAQIEAAQTRYDAASAQQRADKDALQQANQMLTTQLEAVRTELLAQTAAHARLATQLQEESTLRLTLDTQLTALKERLAEHEQHRASLEEKHQHAREALEHYRAATRDQRDQDVRRHEQQVQTLQAEIRQLRQDLIIRNEDITRSNQEGVRMVTELSHARQALLEEQTRGRAQEDQLAQLRQVESQKQRLEQQLREQATASEQLAARHGALEENCRRMEAQWHQSQLALAAAVARSEAQETLAAQLREFLHHTTAHQEAPAGEQGIPDGTRGASDS